ncbi:hypothetical protein Cva_01671 [Caedimonas varicaedens]|uniref:Uncharacterized protein n=1 Tax=Caedimonas varicaedens TaxID=1629334 RepID=A0A0K8MEQ7_9PROT|nr:hypothetical protein Cva_01671 [Caedimonas varicaedens]
MFNKTAGLLALEKLPRFIDHDDKGLGTVGFGNHLIDLNHEHLNNHGQELGMITKIVRFNDHQAVRKIHVGGFIKKTAVISRTGKLMKQMPHISRFLVLMGGEKPCHIFQSGVILFLLPYALNGFGNVVILGIGGTDQGGGHHLNQGI